MKVDELEHETLKFFGNTKFSEVQQIIDLKSSLWGRIEGEIDTEKERELKDKTQ